MFVSFTNVRLGYWVSRFCESPASSPNWEMPSFWQSRQIKFVSAMDHCYPHASREKQDRGKVGMTRESGALALAAGAAIVTVLFAASSANAMPKFATERLQLLQPLAELASVRAREDTEVQPGVLEATRWYHYFAEQGHAEARHNLALIYHLGQGVPLNHVEAARWYRAEQGHAGAQNNLGHMYKSGDGVPQNTVEAVKWYRKAAEQGAAQAQFNLGLMYKTGEGVPVNTIEAVQWYHRAAKQGVAQAQINLGVAYAKGQDIPFDVVQAHKWFDLAAAQGITNGAALRDFVAQSMTQAQIEEADILARKCADQYRNVHQGEAALGELGDAAR